VNRDHIVRGKRISAVHDANEVMHSAVHAVIDGQPANPTWCAIYGVEVEARFVGSVVCGEL
jgi:hypothetical protein